MSDLHATTGPQPAKRRWWPWAAGGLAALLLLLTIGYLGLDSWLRQELERQVASRSQGRYQLRIGALHTSLWTRSIRLQGLQLQPAANSRWRTERDWPRLRADVAELRVGGVGLWALLRGQVVPVDTVVVVGTRLWVGQVPPQLLAGPPLYQRLPARVQGVRVGYLGLHNLRAAYGNEARPEARLRDVDLAAGDVLLSQAGAADTTRLAYARTLALRFAGVTMQARHHRLAVGRGLFSTARHHLTLDSLRIRPLRQPAGHQLAVDLTLPRLALTGIHLPGLARRELRLDSLVLRGPRLVLALPAQVLPSLPAALAACQGRAWLRHLVLRDGYVHLAHNRADPTARNIAISATDLRLDAAGAADHTRVLYARAWNVRTGAVSGMIDAPYYRLGCASLHLATREGLAEATNLHLIPTMPPAVLVRRKAHQSPHLSGRLSQLRITGLDFGALQRHHALRARLVLVRQPRVEVAGDARFPLPRQASSVTPETLGRLPFPYNIRQVRVEEGNLYTAYVAPKGGRGTIRFTHLNATLTNLTNDPRRMSRTHPLVVRGTGRLQDQCRVKIAIWAPLLDPQGTHWGEATFGPAPFSMLNPMTEPTRMIRFAHGRIRRITLQLRVDRRRAQGTMRAEYDGLKLALLTRHGGRDQQNLVSNAGSSLLNGLVVRDNNPRRPGAELQVGTMRSERDPRFTVVVFWRQNLISGLLNSAGVPQKLAVAIGQQQ
jgi:hypothetical protein